MLDDVTSYETDSMADGGAPPMSRSQRREYIAAMTSELAEMALGDHDHELASLLRAVSRFAGSS